jgi:ankyrin repeat protein
MEAARILLENGANVNAVDRKGMTPIMGAARLGYGPMVQLLLDHGANVSITDDRGWNAENHAAAGEHLEVVTMLKDAATRAKEEAEAAATRAKEEAANQAKCVAFAMGHHARLGVGSRVQGLHPEVLRMVLEYV